MYQIKLSQIKYVVIGKTTKKSIKDLFSLSQGGMKSQYKEMSAMQNMGVGKTRIYLMGKHLFELSKLQTE